MAKKRVRTVPSTHAARQTAAAREGLARIDSRGPHARAEIRKLYERAKVRVPPEFRAPRPRPGGKNK